MINDVIKFSQIFENVIKFTLFFEIFMIFYDHIFIVFYMTNVVIKMML